ncbi:MAG: hypothetical protein J6Y93_04495, partial [Treponema sp.]|nr:hypothetical protein [Treponema sp.]
DAKLYYERIVEDRNAGTYKYGSKKALIYIYRAREEYDLAVSTAQSMISEYGEQAENDRIPAILRELKALSSTGNTKLAVKKNEYESAGAEKTPQGRTAGTELAQLYYDSLMLTEAQELAVKLLALQKKNIKTESSGAASNAALLGMIYRSNLQNRRAGEIYLEAAEYYRNSGKEGEAARALYNSAEAFNAAGLYGDSDAVVNNLKKLYPDSTWTKKAGEL